MIDMIDMIDSEHTLRARRERVAFFIRMLRT
jgi:hypothetical protein